MFLGGKMKNIFKLILVGIAILKPVFAYQGNFMIDNQSSCILKINPKIGNKFAVNAPGEIKPHSQIPIQFKFDDGIIETLLAYDISCNNKNSGLISVTTEMYHGYLSLSKNTSTNATLFADIDNNGNFILTNS